MSLWRCYWSFSWPRLLLGGWLKFCGDLVGYVAPLGIKVIVDYVQSPSQVRLSASLTVPRVRADHF